MGRAGESLEIFLQPGELYFGKAGTWIRTVLGSCVSITVWQPRLRVGGMCHYMLPHRGAKAAGPLDGRYGDEAVALLLRDLATVGVSPRDCEAKLFGGGNMFPKALAGRDTMNVSARNIQAGRELTDRHGFRMVAEHVGGIGHRTLIFDIATGSAWLKHHIRSPV